MLRYLKLIGLFARVNVQNNAAYRFDVLVHVVMALVQVGAELVGLWTIFSNTRSLAGWSAYEILVLLGVFRIMTGVIALMISPNMRAVMEDVRKGTLDFILLMPINSQFYASARRMALWRLADIVVGVALIIFAGAKLSLTLSTGRILSFMVMLAAGIVIVYSVWLALATLAFWFTRITNIEMVFWNLFEAGRYPVNIYRPWVRWGLTYIIPLALLTSSPASALVGKASPTGVTGAVLLAFMAFLFSSVFWRFGLRHYTGASA